MRAILIDPFAREIKEVDYDGDYKKIYDLIDCTTFDVVNVPSGNDGIYVDDEGLYKIKQAWFTYRYNNHSMHKNVQLVNKALVVGCDDEGDSTDATDTVEGIRHRITWGFVH